MSSLKRTLVRGALWALGGRAVSMLANFVLSVELAHLLPRASFGAFFVAFSTVVIASGIAAIGMDQLVVRMAAIRLHEEDHALLVQWVVRCLSVAVCSAVVAAVVSFFALPTLCRDLLGAPELAGTAAPMTVWIVFVVIQQQLAETFRGFSELNVTMMLNSIRNGGMIGGVTSCVTVAVYGLVGRPDLEGTLWLMGIVAAGVTAVGSALLWARLRMWGSVVSHWHARTNSTALGSVLNQAWPMWLAALAVYVNAQVGTWIASVVDNPSQVALYGVSQRAMLLVLSPMVLIFAILPPVVARLHASGEMKRLEGIMRAMGGLTLVPALVALVAMVAFGRALLAQIFGHDYVGAYSMVVVLCVGQAVNVATGGWQIVLPMVGNRGMTLLTSVLAPALQISFGFVLGNAYGVEGVAIAFCAATILANGVGMYLVHRSVGIWTAASLGRTALVPTLNSLRTGFR